MTILGYQDRNDELVNQNSKYIRSDHLVAGFTFEPKNDTRITLEGFLKKYSNYPVSIKDGVSLANLGGDFGVFGSEDISSVGEGRAYGLEVLYQKKLSRRVYGTVAYTLFWSEYTGLVEGDYKPALWDNRHLLSLTGGYKFGNNWEFGLRYRYLGPAPFIEVNEAATEIVYPIIVNDYTNLGENRLTAYSVTDVRIDKKWNFSGWSLDLYFDISNLFGSDVPRSPQYGLDLDDNGEVIIPRNLIQIEDEISATFELLKVLHQYNSSNAWTLLIAPDHVPSKALLDSCSIDTSKLLVIRQKHLVNLEYVLNSALHNGNFAAVITWTDIVNNQLLTNLSFDLSKTNTKLYCFTKNAQTTEIPLAQ